MKTVLPLILALFLAACAPQVTASPEATVTPPPTATILPTPTFHPEFMALQELVSNSGGRFTLRPDGMIEDGGQAIPGLKVDAKGGMTLTVDGEEVTLDPAQVQFDDEAGFSANGYEYDEEKGAWVEAGSEAVLHAQADFEKYGYPTEGLEWVEDENGVRAIDPETEEVVYENGEFSLRFAVLNATDLDPTPYEPMDKERVGRVNVPTDQTSADYIFPMLKTVRMQILETYGVDFHDYGGSYTDMMIDPG